MSADLFGYKYSGSARLKYFDCLGIHRSPVLFQIPNGHDIKIDNIKQKIKEIKNSIKMIKKNTNSKAVILQKLPVYLKVSNSYR